MHVIDAAAVDGRDPVEDYRIIEEELRAYDPALADRPRLVAANKMDLPDAEAGLERFRQAYPELEVFPISGATHQGLDPLLRRLATILDELPDVSESVIKEEADESSHKVYRLERKEPFVIERQGNEFVVKSEELEKLVKMTNFQQFDAVKRFQRILKLRGVDDGLRKRGAKDGDSIRIGDMVFDFVE